MKKLLIAFLLLLIFQDPPLYSQTGQNCFNTQFHNSATNRDSVNAYLLGYLCAMVYPDYLRFLEPAPTPGPGSNWVKFFQHNNDTFVRKYASKLAYMFYDPTQVPTLTTTTITTQITTNNISNLLAATPPPNVVSAGGGRVIFDFQYQCNPNGYDPEAIIISTPATIYVVFRGTDRVDCNTNPVLNNFGYEWGEWLGTDFKFLPRTWPNISGQVHRGFIESLNYAGFADSVASRIKNKYGGANKKIWITGHSLGGAHAQLFALLLKLNYGIQAQGIYLFESPHAGDASFVSQMNSTFGKSHIQRFEFSDDPIPTLPFQMFPFSYGRVGVRNYFSDINQMTSGQEQIPIWDDMKMACGLSNLLLAGTVKLETLYSCGGVFCFHDPTWVLKALRNHLAHSLYTFLPADVPLPEVSVNTCTTAEIQKGNQNNLLLNAVDVLEKAVGNFISSSINFANNVLGTVPGFSEGNYKIACYGFSRNNTRKYLYWNGTDKSQLQINTTGTVFSIQHKAVGGYYFIAAGSKMVADIKVPNLGGPDARNTPKVLIQKSGNFPLGAFGDEDTWYLLPISGNTYVLYNWNTHCILDAADNCLGGGDCGVNDTPASTPDRTQIWILEKQ